MNSKNYRVLVFDMDGTLTDPRRIVEYALRKVVDEMGLSADIGDISRFIGPPLRESLAPLVSDPARRQEAITRYQALEASNVSMNDLYEGVPEMLKALHRYGYRLLMASSKQEACALSILRHFGLDAFFSGAFGAVADAGRIQKTEILRHALTQTSADAENTLMIGDRYHDLEAAKAVGIDGLGVLYGYGSREELKAYNPIYLATSPSDVARYLGCRE